MYIEVVERTMSCSFLTLPVPKNRSIQMAESRQRGTCQGSLPVGMSTNRHAVRTSAQLPGLVERALDVCDPEAAAWRVKQKQPGCKAKRHSLAPGIAMTLETARRSKSASLLGHGRPALRILRHQPTRNAPSACRSQSGASPRRVAEVQRLFEELRPRTVFNLVAVIDMRPEALSRGSPARREPREGNHSVACGRSAHSKGRYD